MFLMIMEQLPRLSSDAPRKRGGAIVRAVHCLTYEREHRYSVCVRVCVCVCVCLCVYQYMAHSPMLSFVLQ